MLPRLAALLALAALHAGCSSDDPVLDAMQSAELQASFEASLLSQNLVTELVFAAARGDLDVSGAVYGPSPAAGFDHRLALQGGVFPFGTGDLTIDFSVAGDAGPTDPYAPGVDLSDDAAVNVVAHVVFDGQSPIGVLLGLVGDLEISTITNHPQTPVTSVTGTFDIAYADYDVDLATTDLVMVLDVVAETVTSVTGVVAGTIDIPDLALDVDVTLTGLGASIEATFRVAKQTIEALFDL